MDVVQVRWCITSCTLEITHPSRSRRGPLPRARLLHMIEVTVDDRLGTKLNVLCNADDTIGDLKKLIAYVSGTRAESIRLQKTHIVFRDHITLEDYEIHDGTNLELFYN